MSNPASSSESPAGPVRSSSPLNRASIIAIAGGLLALISFFALSYFGFSSGGVSGSITGRDLATVSTTGITQGYAILWLVPIAGIVALVIGLLPLGLRTISQRASGITFVVAGVVGLVTLIVTYVRIQSLTQGTSSFGLSYGFGIGYWLSALGMVALIVAGVLAPRTSQS